MALCDILRCRANLVANGGKADKESRRPDFIGKTIGPMKAAPLVSHFPRAMVVAAKREKLRAI